MNTLTIQSLRLKNFKGISNFTLEPRGNNIDVLGENATGKTTLMDGFLWLIFGKDSQGKSDFQLKPVAPDGSEHHNLDTEVEAALEYNNKQVVLLRRFSEKWTKKRGSARPDFTGHTTDYFIDEVPAKKKEFDAKIAELIDVTAFKLVTNPMEFNQMHWTGRRQILIDMCGDVSDQDVIDSDAKLSKLSGILNGRSIDDHKKKIQSKKRGVNKELEQIPVRIDEISTSIQDSAKPIQKDIDLLHKALDEQRKNLRALQSNEALSEKQVRLNEVNAAILEEKNNANSKALARKKPINTEIDKLETEARTITNQIRSFEDEVKRDQNRNRVTAEAMDNLRKRFYKKRDTEKEISTVCPTCDQALPEDKIQSAFDNYHQVKAKALEELQVEGKSLKETFQDREESIAQAQEKITYLRDQLEKINPKIAAKKKELESVYFPINVDALYNEKNILESEIKALRNGSMVQEKNLLEKVRETQVKIDAWMQGEATFKASEKARARIDELENQEKALAGVYEKLESELYLIEQFIVRKVEMLEGQINSRFKMATFRLFETQINEGIKECCETLYEGIPYNHGLNNAARINVGLDIISTLSDYYGFQAPIFVDNKESVNNLIPIDAQVISLIVSKDKNLKVI